MSKLFNKYFINIGTNLKKTPKETTNIYSIQNIKPCLMDFKEISTIDVLNIRKSIRKTSTEDNDDIPTNIILLSSHFKIFN